MLICTLPQMSKTQIKALEMKLSTLRAELATCTTAAMRASVQGSIDAAEWEMCLLVRHGRR